MAMTTTALRRAWSPACQASQMTTVALHGTGRVTVDRRTVDAVAALNACLVAHDYRTRRADTGAYNCLAGETEVITRDGLFPIADLVGQEVELLTRRAAEGNSRGGPGRWARAPIRSYGVQPLRRITLGSGGLTKTIYATPGHRWYVRRDDQRHVSEVTTDELEPAEGRRGHRLLSLRPQSVASRTIPSPVGICAGLVFGDGAVNRRGAQIALFGSRNMALARYFPADQSRNTYHYDTHAEPHLLISGLPRSWKSAPRFDEGSAHLYGWLAGYFAADGRVAKGGSSIELNSTTKEHLELAQTVALRLGIATRPIQSRKREVTPPGSNAPMMSTIYSLRFMRESLDSSFFLIAAHRERFNAPRRAKKHADWRVLAVEETDRVEEVFCAEVPETECFALGDFILTGNCRPITGGTGYSLHAYGVAVDLNWTTNPYGKTLVTDMPPAMRTAVKAIRTRNDKQVWTWGGDWAGNKDAMHWQIDVTPADLARGIDPATVPGSKPATPTTPPPPPPPKGLTMDPDVTAAFDRLGKGIVDAVARLDRLEAELLKPVGTDGSTRADRMAALPGRVDALERKLDTILALLRDG